MADACRSCGAALAPGATACDLCGTPAGTVDTDACPRCGHHLPPDSRFCNACGLELTPGETPGLGETPTPVEPPAVTRTTERPPSAVGKKALTVVGAGLLAVVVLYGLTLWSDRSAPAASLDPPDAAATGTADPAVGAASPIPDGAPPLPDSLQAAADGFAGQGTPEGWYESGRYYLTAAFGSIQTDPQSSVRWARRAIADFEKSLALRDDSQVRVALAEAATFDPSDPMRPIQELRTILAADPDNLDATFLLGERRLMIGRTDSARVAFERVLALAPPGSPVRDRAEAALASMAAE